MMGVISLKTKQPLWNSRPFSSYYPICLPPFLPNLSKRVFWTRCAPDVPVVSLETALETSIPTITQKQLFSRSPVTSTLLSPTVSSQASPFLSSGQHRAQPALPASCIFDTPPQAAEQPPGGLVTSLATLPAPLLLLYPPQPGNARAPRTPFFLAKCVHTGYVICSAQCKVITQAPRPQIITTSKTAAAKQESKPQHRLRARPLQQHSHPRLGPACSGPANSSPVQNSPLNSRLPSPAVY